MRQWRWIGVLAGLAGVGAGELVAAFVRQGSSPYAAVGDAVVDLTPNSVKDLAIAVFGPADKLVLLAGVALVLAVAAAFIGQLAETRPNLAMLGVGLFGVVGVLAAVTRPGAGVMDAVPSVIGAAVAGATLRGLGGTIRRHQEWADGVPTEDAGAAAGGEAGYGEYGRRRLLVSGGLVAAGAVGAVALSRWLVLDRYGAARSRAGLTVPTPGSTAPPPVRDAATDIQGLSRFYTPNDSFYRVDTALTVPQIAAEDWKLRIHGMVDQPVTITYRQLLERSMIERDITIACVSNPVGGGYVGNARWIGVPVKGLLEQVGVHRGADQVVCRSYDGMTIGTPTAALTDGRDAMLAVAMNGDLLPLDHGFPVRMVVPGLYGYVSACKWIVDMELTTFDAYDAYWIKQGWAQQAEIKTASRIDTPRDGARLSAGVVNVAGVAWAQHRGIDRVEVRVGDGDWQTAELAEGPVDTWRQWIFRWHAKPGVHKLRVRATDGRGDRQTGASQGVYPSGATGWHTVEVTVNG